MPEDTNCSCSRENAGRQQACGSGPTAPCKGADNLVFAHDALHRKILSVLPGTHAVEEPWMTVCLFFCLGSCGRETAQLHASARQRMTVHLPRL